jgi:hypothetical protein
MVGAWSEHGRWCSAGWAACPHHLSLENRHRLPNSTLGMKGRRCILVHPSQRIPDVARSAFRIAGMKFCILKNRRAALRQIFSIRELIFYIEKNDD